MAPVEREHCAECNAVHPIHKLYEVWVETCRQTYRSPVEHESRLLCYDCFHQEPRDDAYERAERGDEWERRGGGGL